MMFAQDYANSTMPIRRAIKFATMAHAHQVRKGTTVPYIVHPFEVCQILSQAGVADELICAGLLHDVVEDTKYGIEDIRREFGDMVANLVTACSENKSLSWEIRKRHTIDYLQNEASLEVLLISCGDKLANLRSTKQALEEVGSQVWSRFNRGYDAQKWYYEGLLQAFARLEGYEMAKEFQVLYHCVFGEEI